MTALDRELRSKSQLGCGLRRISLAMDTHVNQATPHHVLGHPRLTIVYANRFACDQSAGFANLSGSPGAR
ncbi:hypothetical protein RSO01_66690 [Reyranella soli]|uniref:Uncharacterized protein n=1 Tax=Reyranella soli TaxID=1230389 RepID=A0A512NKM9_9HYPH|nr:hypothetical protein RSO01_66690 [Reyranella soli]